MDGIKALVDYHVQTEPQASTSVEHSDTGYPKMGIGSSKMEKWSPTTTGRAATRVEAVNQR
jgi:hypothetical protein